MRISVPVNHNYFEEAPIPESALCDAFCTTKKGAKDLRYLFSSVHELKLGANRLERVKVVHFKRKRKFEPDHDKLVIKLYCKEYSEKEKDYIVQTGLFAGILFYKGCKINITTKYGSALLKRMLNFVADIYVDNEQENAQKDEKENQFLYIIAYLFIQSLEKAAILGLPQHYQKRQERSHKVRGTTVFTEYLKRDIPFHGKLTTIYRERAFIREIVDVLYLALRKLERLFGKEIQSRLLGLNQLLKQHYSGRYVSYELIQKAKNNQAINNPMFGGFKNVLEYAEIILMNQDLYPDDVRSHLDCKGYLFDIAELYELYLEKLLKRNLPNWSINGQEELPIYQEQFYARSLFPDIVMRHRDTNKVVVFDAKFKNMEMHRKDVDRLDLHQIHAYSGFFKDQLVASGLIYPLSKNVNIAKSHSKSIYGNDLKEIHFLVDGVFTSTNQSMKDLIENEEAFIERVSSVINQ